MPQPPDVIRETTRNIFREMFRMVVEDLLAMPDDRAIVMDAFFGEPLGESRQLFDRDKVVFLVPTEAFHKAEYQRRFRQGWRLQFMQALENCPDPEATFMSGWVQHRLLYNQYVREECKKHNLPLLITAGQLSLEDSYNAVRDHFHLTR